jgi:hypothetical protein
MLAFQESACSGTFRLAESAPVGSVRAPARERLQMQPGAAWPAFWRWSLMTIIVGLSPSARSVWAFDAMVWIGVEWAREHRSVWAAEVGAETPAVCSSGLPYSLVSPPWLSWLARIFIATCDGAFDLAKRGLYRGQQRCDGGGMQRHNQID